MKLVILITILCLTIFSTESKRRRTNKKKLDQKSIEGLIKEFEKDYEEKVDKKNEKDVRKLVTKLENKLISPDVNCEAEYCNNIISLINKSNNERLLKIRNHALRRIYLENIKNVEESNFVSAKDTGIKISELQDNLFIQGPDKGACFLYSILYAISRTQDLKDDLDSIVKQTDSSYIVKLGEIDTDGKQPYFEVKKEDINEIVTRNKLGKIFEVDELSPSTNEVLVAIGMAIQKKIKDRFPNLVFGMEEDIQYGIYSEKDLIFDSQVFQVPLTDPVAGKIKVDTKIFQKDGKINSNGNKYTGKFAVSIATHEYGGHAISAYYSDGKWNVFDNFSKDEIHKHHLDIKDLSNYDISNITIIGKEVKIDKKIKRTKISKKTKLK